MIETVMPRNRRSHNRVEVHIVGQFKPLSKPAVPFLGITRDFSCGGFSFESQFSDLGPGDSLALKFKHPDSELVVSTQGIIVWKRNTEKFICLMGIKFRDISDAASSRILKILSAVCDVPVDFLLSGADTGIDKIRTAEIAQADYNEAACTESARGNNKSLSILIAVTAAAVLIFSLPAQLDNLIKGIATPEPDSVKLTYYQHNKENPLLSQTNNVTLNGLVKEASYKSSHEASMFEPVQYESGQPGLSPTDISGADNAGFYIQVGSWKNPDYARETLDQLIENYPDSYIVVEKEFHVIRIPDIMTKTEGDRIIKDIEDKYNLRPLLALKRK
jgi:hypothetical protein